MKVKTHKSNTSTYYESNKMALKWGDIIHLVKKYTLADSHKNPDGEIILLAIGDNRQMVLVDTYNKLEKYDGKGYPPGHISNWTPWTPTWDFYDGEITISN